MSWQVGCVANSLDKKKNRKIKGRTAAVIHGLVQMREIPLRLRMLAIFGI